MKQGLVEQRQYKEQENSHPEWPDHEPIRFSKESGLRSPVFISLKKDAHLFYKPWGAEKAELQRNLGLLQRGETTQ